MKLNIIILFLSVIVSLALSKFKHRSYAKKSSLKKKQFGITPGTPVPNQSNIDTAPVITGKVPNVVWNVTLDAEDNKNTGRHSLKQVSDFLLNRGLTSGQIKSIVQMIDQNSGKILYVKDGSISDDEYADFYTLFIVPFQQCDTDSNNLLNEGELAAAFQLPQFSFLSQISAPEIAKIIFMMDQQITLNFFDYIFLRRVNNAINHCGENYLLNPGNIYCALSITSPRIRRFYTPDERMMYYASQILFDGHYSGQRGYMTIVQFVGLAQIYNYFNDYEIPFDEGFVNAQDFTRAIQEQMLPYCYTPDVVNAMFQDNPRKNFLSLAIAIFTFRMYQGAADATTGFFIQTSFDSLMQHSFPQRLAFIINQSQTPSQDEVEAASKTFWNIQTLHEDQYLRNFNNLVFLQKSQKVQLRKNKKNIPAQYYTQAAAMTFPQGSPLIFGIFNTYNNATCGLADFLQFYRLSLLYLEFDPYGIQRLNNEVMQTKKKTQTQLILGAVEKQKLIQIKDFLQSRPDFYINYKQFLSFFFVKQVFELFKIGGTSFQSPITYLIEGFTKLGMRISHYAIQNTAGLYDVQNNSRNINVQQTFFIAFNEEILAMRNRYAGKLNQPNVP